MDDSGGKRKQGEAREFWEAAIRLWSESGLSVREFCRREGLAEHTFFSWRRDVAGWIAAVSKDGQAAPDAKVGEWPLPAGGEGKGRRSPTVSLKRNAGKPE